MATWVEDIVEALKNLNGVSNYDELYKEVKKIRKETLPDNWEASIRGAIERHSSDSEAYDGKKDIFYSVDGLGKGVWGLRNFDEKIIYPVDMIDSQTVREENTIYRIVGDTKLANDIKKLHNHKCQICGQAIDLKDRKYSEAHHIKPLGEPHNGPDIAENIIVLCPNHHVECDYGAIKLEFNNIITLRQHKIGKDFIDYHNKNIYKGDK